MKKISTLFLLMLCCSIQPAFAQLEVTGSDQFGRIFDLTYDASVPNKVYAVTLGNHIVVSEDNGASWEILYSLILEENAAVKDLKLSADGSALTFSAYAVGTTLSAIMVYDIASASIIKTFPLPNQSDFAYAISYDFYDSDMDVLLVDTNFPAGINTEGKTFYTADGGTTWDLIYYTNENDTVFINKVAINPTDPNNIFLTRGNGSTDIDGGLLISDNAGQTFTEKLPGIILDPITFDPSNEQTVFVGTGISFGSVTENLYKSTDGGETFAVVPVNWTAGLLDNITVIKFNEANPSQLIVLEDNEIAVSDDGGLTFTSIVYPDVDDSENYYYGLSVSYNPQNLDEVLIGSNYIPFRSNDGGITLNAVKTPYFATTGNVTLFRNEADANLYYGVQSGYVHRDLNSSEDTPYNIRPLSVFSNNGGATYYADQFIPNRLFSFTSSFSGSNLKVSNDNGATENQLVSLFSNGFRAVATYPSNTNTILASFSGFEPSETVLKKIDFNDLNAVVETDIALPVVDIINGILIDASDKITIAIGIEVYSSTDGGANWSNNSDGLENLTTNDLILDLVQDPLAVNRLALATSSGIFISEDNGATWSQKTTDLVFNVAFSTETEGAMTASTYSSQISDFSIHYSIDSGVTWESISNEQLLGIGSGASTYYFYENSVTVFVGTFDIGLIEYTIDLTLLGTPEFEDVSAISMYPNPTHDFLNIKLKNSEVATITVYAMSGAKVMDVESTNIVNIAGLSAGLYLVRVQDTNNQVIFKRIVKE